MRAESDGPAHARVHPAVEGGCDRLYPHAWPAEAKPVQVRAGPTVGVRLVKE
jgi:hypothetical protein